MEKRRRTFDEDFEPFHIGERVRLNDDATESTISAYELIIDPTERHERRQVADFVLRAAQAGFQQAIGPVVIPSIGNVKRGAESRPVIAVQFFFEKP